MCVTNSPVCAGARVSRRKLAERSGGVYGAIPGDAKCPRNRWNGAVIRCSVSDPVEQQRPLDLFDGLGDLDAAGAGVGAIEGRAAAEDPGLLVQDVEALLGR